MKKDKNIKLEDIKGELISKIDTLWTQLDKDRMNALYINEKVKEHLTWTGETDGSEGDISLKGKLPHIFEVAQTIVAQYKNSLFKTPESLFSVEPSIGTDEEWADTQKYSILDTITKGKVINAYISAVEKQVWRGEAILFHEWGERKAKRKIVTPVLDKNNEPVMENGQPKFDFDVEEYTDYEGVKVKCIEPQDFVFDVTKISPFSTSNYNQDEFNSPDCFKIKRSWMSLAAIKADKLFDLSSEDEEVLKSLKDNEPRTDQNFDDFTNKFSNRHTNGDMIEILEYWGDFALKNGTVLKDYRIITAGSKVVLRFEENPYTRCPFVWKPAYVDLKTRRGISPLVPAIEYNETATNMYEVGKTQLKFSVNPAYLVKNGTHMEDLPETIEPGQWINITDGLGNADYPQEIQSYKNAPMGFDYLTMQEKSIEMVTGVSKYESGDATGIARTATETNQIISGANLRFSSDLLDFCNIVIIPSIEIIATMMYENTPVDKKEQVKVPNDNGGIDTKEVTDDIRGGNYKYSIGSTQAIIERKAKLKDLLPVVQALAPAMKSQGNDFNWLEIWQYVASTNELENPKRFVNSDPLSTALNKIPQEHREQLTNVLVQMVQNPQLIQKAFQQTPPPVPQPNQMVKDIASKAICDDSTYPEAVKMFLLQQGQLQPTQDYVEKMRKRTVNG